MVAKLPEGERPKRTVQKLTNGDRKWICKRKNEQPSEKFADMISAFRQQRNPEVELKSGTVSGILKQQTKWLAIPDGQENGARTRASKEPDLEVALYAWRAQKVAGGEKVRDEDLRNRARELALSMGINMDKSTKGLSFSSGWLDRFKKRNGIKQTCYNRHRGDVPKPIPALPDTGLLPEYMGLMPEGLPPSHVDEHGIPMPQTPTSLEGPSLSQHLVPLGHMAMMPADLQQLHGMALGMHELPMYVPLPAVVRAGVPPRRARRHPNLATLWPAFLVSFTIEPQSSACVPLPPDPGVQTAYCVTQWTPGRQSWQVGDCKISIDHRLTIKV